MPTWFSRDDAIVMCLVPMNAILQTLRMLDFANTSWVLNLGDVTSGGGSTSHRSGRTRKLMSYAS
jgi:hypothetical protein